MFVSDIVIVALIAAVPATIGAIGTFLGVWVSLRNSRKLEAVHKATNSIVEQGRRDSRELGHFEGAADEKARVSGL